MILFTGNAILIFGLLLVILSALKKPAHHSTENFTGKEETLSKKRKKCQLGPTPNREETQVKVQECANLHMQVESPTAYVPQAVHLLGLPEYRYLWNRIRESLAAAKSQDEKIFYGHLKRYISNQSDQNNGRVLLSAVEKTRDLVNEFETTMKEFDNNENDYDDIRLYRGWIKGLIGEAEENFPLPE